jgi:Gpi18-like mannosyltransferase
MSLTGVSIVCCFAFLGVFGAACRGLKKNTVPLIEDKQILPSLYLLLVLGGILRILIAPLIEGYPSDIACFKGWSHAVFSKGMSNFYSSEMYVDYPPAYLYVLYLIGFLRNALDIGYDSPVFLIILKLPSILADVFSSFVIFLAARKISGAAALLLATLYLFNPAVIFNSTVYGQIDSFLMLFIIIMLIALYNEKLVAASVVFVVALLIKPQALVFSPLLLCECVRNVIKIKSLKTVILSLLCAVAAFLVIVFPFYLKQDIFQIVSLYRKTLSSYPYATLNACNLFALFGGNGASEDAVVFIFSYRWWGYILLASAAGFAMYIYLVGRGASKLFYAAFVLAAAFFVLGVRIHERYLFPVIGVSLLSYIYTTDRRFLYLFFGFSLTAFLNQALLIDLVLTKNSFWFLPDDMAVRVLSFVNIGLLVYLVKVGIDLYVRNKKTISEIVPLPQSSITAGSLLIDAESKRCLLRKDYVLMAFLTVLCLAMALYNLGSFSAPQTFWRPLNAGQSFYADLGTSKNIHRINYFMGLGEGSYAIDFSDDAITWTGERIIEQKTTFEPVGWQGLTLDTNARYVRISVQKPGATLNEIGFFDNAGGSSLPIKTFFSDGIKTETAGDGIADNVFDEQETVVSAPSFFNGMYFDEVYHARTAYEYLHRIEPTETSHPPLGKDIIAAGIAIFGMTPFGWRIMAVLFGIAMIPAIYCFAKRLFGKSGYAFIAAFLFAFDFLRFTYTRIGVIDCFAVFFIIMMYYYMYRYFTMNFFCVPLWRTFVPLFLSGIFFGLGAATKWTAVFGGVGLAAILFCSLGLRFFEYVKAVKLQKGCASDEQARIIRLFFPYASITLLWCVVVFVLLPLVIYVLAYIPFLMVHGPGHGVADIFSLQNHMYEYHHTKQATHPFASMWWEWPIIKKPLWLYMGKDISVGQISSIVAMGNPAIWWAGVPAMLAAMFVAVGRKDKGMLAVLLAAASQYVPWMVRPIDLTFIYHFFAATPFMILCIAYVLMAIADKLPRFKYAIAAYLAAVITLFVLFYPILSGMAVSKSYAATYLKWFSSWIFFV